MIAKSYLDEVRERLRAVGDITVRVVRDPGGKLKIFADLGGHRAELRVMRDLEPAAEGDVQFAGHSFSDVARLLESVQSAVHISARDIDEIETRIDSASPGPWTAFIESEGGQAGCDVIRVTENNDEPDMYLWLGSDLASSEIFLFIAAARQDIPTLLADARP